MGLEKLSLWAYVGIFVKKLDKGEGPKDGGGAFKGELLGGVATEPAGT